MWVRISIVELSNILVSVGFDKSNGFKHNFLDFMELLNNFLIEAHDSVVNLAQLRVEIGDFVVALLTEIENR